MSTKFEFVVFLLEMRTEPNLEPFCKLDKNPNRTEPKQWGFFFISNFYRATLCYSGSLYAVVVCPSVWCGCSVPAAEWLDSSAVGIAQLAHTAGESILCREDGDAALPKW